MRSDTSGSISRGRRSGRVIASERTVLSRAQSVPSGGVSEEEEMVDRAKRTGNIGIDWLGVNGEQKQKYGLK